jgi:hypothetical protein
LNTDQIAFLVTPEGQCALQQAALLPNDRLTRLQRLRRDWPAPVAAGIVELLELRYRARNKFDHAAQMFFTPEGLEQSTGDAISAYRATRFPFGVPLLDACCGIGGDALALRRQAPVLAVDSNPVACACARANADALPEPDGFALHTLCADVTMLDLARLRDRGIQAAFFDPSRRVSTTHGRSRARDSEDYLPPLSWTAALREHFPHVGVKVSPAIDDTALLQTGGRVEFIAEGGECKEAVLWFGDTARFANGVEDTASYSVQTAEGRASHIYTEPLPDGEPYCATIVRRGAAPVTLVRTIADDVPTAPTREWLYEPNPAVIRAHLIAQIALPRDGALLAPSIAYFTADRYIPTPFAVAYRVLDAMPFHVKNVSAWLRTHKRRVDVVKKRGVSLEPEAVRRQLAAPALAEYPPVVLVLARVQDRTIALLCDPPQNAP